MADFRSVQKVRQGVTTEYYAVVGQNVPITTGDRLIMSFDTELALDEIIMRKVGGGGTFNWSMNIVYPQTGIANHIFSSTGDFTLNGGSGAGKPTLRTWFRVPANTSLIVDFSAVTASATVELIVVGK